MQEMYSFTNRYVTKIAITITYNYMNYMKLYETLIVDLDKLIFMTQRLYIDWMLKSSSHLEDRRI